jgi:hypothetical protein
MPAGGSPDLPVFLPNNDLPGDPKCAERSSMWSDDKGVIMVGAQRHDFGIDERQGATAPAANMTVEIV